MPNKHSYLESKAIWLGKPYPLGATYDGYGTNFAVFSDVAERVELCLFRLGVERRVNLVHGVGGIWHAYIPELGPGSEYGFRVYGPWDPPQGLRCNPNKLLIDPYARELAGEPTWHPSMVGHDGRCDPTDSAPHALKGVVTSSYFDWGNDRKLDIPWNRSIIYEVHVKGFSQCNPEIPEELRGTYAGLAHPASVEYLQKLGITAVELLPVHQFFHDGFLLDKGLRNYWGYHSIGYFAPHNEYSSRRRPHAVVSEFKHMVKVLHQAGIEVILDVVYNHTAEGNHEGPLLSMRGLDNASYYRLVSGRPEYYMDYTGTGNSLNMRHPHVLQLIMDSLRYWIEEMHVDGFRFDLAATLARTMHEVDRLSAFFDLVQQDPVVSRVKLIAEPWDVGDGGYQVGNFPPLWSEWNGKYRDCVRDYWRGVGSALGEFGYRFTGSSDLYQSGARRPHASINFVTCHDGFSLRDLVSYNDKHNLANGEDNRDGESHNRSWNCGHEGETNDREVLALRSRQQRNMLATLFLSQGVPMLLAGDEVGRTQGGNNNVYCQDNATAWFDWSAMDHELLDFTRALISFYAKHPVFRRRGWFQGRPVRPDDTEGVHDIAWFAPEGVEMVGDDWERANANVLGVFLNGHGIATPDDRGRRVLDNSFYLMFNAHHEAKEFILPPARWGAQWQLIMDTERGFLNLKDSLVLSAGKTFRAGPRLLAVWQR
ncbi:MAG TPA: glycogen debranching protein GlgX [Polyangiales bacterium]|nr:glycogen debranching protein GlgX [Polyangiales bacterium]